MDTSRDLTPLVLLVDDQEATARSVEGFLRPKGHVVLKAVTGLQATDLVSKVSPDCILVDSVLPDMDGVDLVRRLKQLPTVYSTTPVLMLTKSVMGKAQRLEALGAGAWDVLIHPLDPSELILRIDTFVRAKQEADRTRDEGLTDASTGFYNVRGILRRTKEITADTTRSDRPLTCVAFGTRRPPDHTGDVDPVVEFAGPVAEALREATRISDTIGRLGPSDFVVLAPGTNQEGALRLADRVLEALEADANREGDGASAAKLKQVRAGFCSVDASASTSAEDLLLRATMALRHAQADDGSFRVRSFEA